jgi:CBS-domain-containing membrane protein
MSKELYACNPDDSILHAEETLRSRQVRRLPVLKQSRNIAGIVSLSDIVREAERELSLKNREISSQEVTETFASVSQPRQHNGPSSF